MIRKLFSEFKIGGLELPNRIVIAPMCQYSADNGDASDWHTVHLSNMLLSGAGLMILEATAVEEIGRITHGCLGLYSDANEASLKRVLAIVRKYSSMPIGIQLGHAGRKASTLRPWDGNRGLSDSEGAWQTVGPSTRPFSESYPIPKALDRSGMDRIIKAFEAAALRADRLGLDLIELHGAHGYLLSQFLSPLANERTDEYGGALENRARFPLEVFDAIRSVWPQKKALGMRINGTDWHPEGITIEESVRFSEFLAARGCDFIHVTSGGNGKIGVTPAPGYQVPLAGEIRAKVRIPTIAVGLITRPPHAEEIITSGQADLVAIARGALNDPRWGWHAAAELGADLPEIPVQYERGAPQSDTTRVIRRIKPNKSL